MKIIDTHVHLDPSVEGGVGNAAAELYAQMRDANITHCLALHLEAQPWGIKEFADAIRPFPEIHGFVNIHPESKDSLAVLDHAIHELGFEGLKLHPRLQEFKVMSDAVVRLAKEAGKMNIPVLIDAFPDGTHLMQGFNPLDYATLANTCPETTFIWAHMGGHYVIDFMMLAKRLNNVWMDTSYSLLYYRGSSITDDLAYAMKSMRFKRILYGSDYPDRPLKVSLEESIHLLNRYNIVASDASAILSGNACELFGWV
jgi:predicted TIM-barrel fold metal-dependent hydrolase